MSISIVWNKGCSVSISALLRFTLTVLFISLPLMRCVGDDVEEVAEFEVMLAEELEIPQLQMLAAYAKVNSALARRVCQLTDIQEQQLAVMDKKWLDAEYNKAANPNQGVGNENGRINEGVAAGFARMFGFGQAQRIQNVQLQPHQISERVCAAIDEHIIKTLEATQQVEYKRELDARESFRRDALADLVIATLDRRMYMTDEQRSTLKPVIAKSLNKQLAWQIYLFNEEYIPVIPNRVFAEVLDKEQMSVLSQWRMNDFDAHQMELQMVGQQELVVIEK